METERCIKCGAPVGSTVPRCPFCGADLTGPPVEGPRFQAALVGMKERSLPPPAQRARGSPAVLAIIAAGGLLFLAGAGLVAYRYLRTPPAESYLATSAVPTPPAAASSAPLAIQGVPVPDPARVDATDVLPSVRRRLTEGGADLGLLDITVSGARNGGVNLKAPGAQITYRFLAEPPTTAGRRDRVELTLSDSAPAPARSTPEAADVRLPDPVCVWSAAWRAAVAAGLDAQADVEARYAKHPKTGKPVWAFNVRDKPDTRREIDGASCAIKIR
jgi:hypothetical protein